MPVALLQGLLTEQPKEPWYKEITKKQLIGALLGASLAGTGGYFLTPKKKGTRKRIRNAALAALAGGLVGGINGENLRMPRLGKPGIQAADSKTGKSLAENVATAAEYGYITSSRGIPTDPSEFKENMFSVSAKSIKGCYSKEGIPAGGYITEYIPIPESNDFEVVARPAPGYTGQVFRVTRNMVKDLM